MIIKSASFFDSGILKMILLFLFMTIGQIAFGQKSERIAMEKVNEASKLHRQGKINEAIQLLKEVEREKFYNDTQVNAICGMSYDFQYYDSIARVGKINYLKKYLSDTTKSILSGAIFDKPKSRKEDLTPIPLVIVKLIYSNDNITYTYSDIDGEFLIEPKIGTYKLELDYNDHIFSKEVNLTNAAYKLSVKIDRVTNVLHDFELIKIDLNNTEIEW
jgi:hypothetical protein